MSDEKEIHIGNFFGSLFGNTTINVSNNYAAPTIPDKEDEGRASEAAVFEALPQYLRNSKMMPVWEGLQRYGLLDEGYRLSEGTTRAAAKYMAQQIYRKARPESTSIDWKPFDLLWPSKNAKTKLRNESDTMEQEKRNVIDNIIRDS